MTDPTPAFLTTSGETIARELLILYLNTGTSQSPTWSAIGKRVSDSSMEYDWGDETSTDILGDAHSTMKKPTITQSFEPLLDSGDAASVIIWEKGVRDHNPQALCNMDLLVAHQYYGVSASTPWAERYPSSMIKPTSIGGEGGGNIKMPYDVTFGGTRSVGKISRGQNGAVTYTADAA